MLFSLIIINYKTAELIRACIQSLFDLPQTNPLEIIVVDNASGDGSVEKLKQAFGDKIKIIANQKNLGFAGANNQGAAIASNEILLFLNSDTLIKENIFFSISSLFESNPAIGIASPLLCLPNGQRQAVAFGHFPTLFKLITQTTKKELKIPDKKSEMEVDWVSGCALAIRRDLFTKIGGWDDNFFLYFEDVDLCRRAKLAGYKAYVNLESKITHLGGQSLSLTRNRKKYYYQSQDYYFHKHYGRLTKLIIIILRKLFKIVKN